MALAPHTGLLGRRTDPGGGNERQVMNTEPWMASTSYRLLSQNLEVH